MLLAFDPSPKHWETDIQNEFTGSNQQCYCFVFITWYLLLIKVNTKYRNLWFGKLSLQNGVMQA